MKSMTIKKIDEGAIFVVDTTSYFSQISPLDLRLATQTISYVPSNIVVAEDDEIEEEAGKPLGTPR